MLSKHIWLAGLVVGPIRTNCYILGNDASHEAILFDPGDEAERIIAFLTEKQLTPRAILLTHGHHDHVLAINDLLAAYPDLEVIISEQERTLVEHPELNSSDGRFAHYRYTPTKYVEGGDVLNFFGMDFYVMETPGHTRGSVCYYLETAKLLFAGDTIFCESYGRTDLPTGSPEEMQRTLRHVLTTLPEEVQILPGHGPSTTVGHEKALHGFDLM